LQRWKDSKPILEDYQRFNEIISQALYSDADKQELAALLVKYHLHLRQEAKARFFTLNEVRGKLFSGTKPPNIVAIGRSGWDGWLELKEDEIGSAAIENTARVVREVAPHVLAVVEAENRLALQLFDDQVLTRHQTSFPHNMLIDGNDARGIDVGVYSKFPIVSMRSNIDAGLPGGRIFSRDCAEYEIDMPGRAPLWLLINHFKSKGYGSPAESNARRKVQVTKAAEIYATRHKKHKWVAVLGDFNDTPESDALSPLLKDTDLKDVMAHPSYTGKPGSRPGTFGTGSASNKIDYILLSPALWANVKDVDVERRGVWAPKSFPHFDTVTGPTDTASDHAALWVDLAL
jgi:endonuclease/exonuclease/phosphatase family metal-dependent hydrolase